MEYLDQAGARQVLEVLASGAFPMGADRFAREVHIIAPNMRAIIPLADFRVPKRLAKTARRDPFEVRINHDFSRIIRSCAARQPTWINQKIIDAYEGLHRLGHAHSVECWQGGALCGGLYGVALGAVFFGESMFSRQRDASKIALIHLAARLCGGRFRLLDVQFMTSHLQQFGAIEISAAQFKERLMIAKNLNADFHALPPQLDGARALQEIGHIS